jgi:2'-5' RNA ligase
MGKIAVDIVLLPSAEMMDWAIELNRKLAGKAPDRIILNKQDSLPHISLAMGCIEAGQVAQIGQILREIAKKHCPGELVATGIQVEKNSNGRNVSVLVVEKTRKLQLLHEEVMKRILNHFTYDVTADMVLSERQVSRASLLWIKGYRQQSSFERFFPHITIGFGRAERGTFPLRFKVSQFALCRLGNNCTCRHILTFARISA